MRGGRLADELQRLADEARASRQRLQELARQAAELRVSLEQSGAMNGDEAAPEEPSAARKLHSVQ
jgi:hypothetical protein